METSGSTLVLRADGSQQPGGMGIGHLMRTLALARTWQQHGGLAILVTAAISEYVAGLFSSNDIPISHLISGVQPGTKEDGQTTAAIASDLSALWVVVDGYQFRSDFNREVHSNHRVMVVDDFAQTTRAPLCSALLDQNINANTQTYEVSDSCITMFGPRFALLPSASQRDEEPPTIGDVRKVLVIMGGAPLPGVQALVTHTAIALSHEDFEVTVAGGPELDVSPDRFRWMGTTPNLSGLIRDADIVVAVAGSVCWQVCYSGVPLLAFSAAPNQVPLARNLTEWGVAIDLGWWEDLNAGAIVDMTKELSSNRTKREDMVKLSYALVDGRGTSRVINKLTPARVTPTVEGA